MIITAYGKPAPQGSKRAVAKGVIIDANPRTKEWRAIVHDACRDAMDAEPEFFRFEGAMWGRMIFSFDRPASVKRSKRPYPSISPDLGKLARATEDSLTSAGFWKDDGQVVEYTRLAKVYVGEDDEALEAPGVYIVMLPKVDLEAVTGPPVTRRRAQ